MKTLAELYQRLSTSSHQARLRELIALGAQAKQDAQCAALLSALSQGDAFARRCALISCFGSQNGEMILRAVSDPSRSVRGLALRLVVLFCDDAQVVEALQLSQELLANPKEAGVSTGHLCISVDREALQRTLDARLREVLESAPSPRRGRPRRRLVPK